jgi:iron complex outermembrane receptor protein
VFETIKSLVTLPSQARRPAVSAGWRATILIGLLPCAALGQTAASPAAVPPAPAAAPAPATDVGLPDVNVVAPSPLLGTGVDRDRVPAETNVLTSRDIAREGAPNTLQALQDQLSSVSLDSASGNPYQPNLFYHGFEASALQGTPEGLAVYVNGVRFNQPFGDTVNFDLIPDMAIDRVNIEGSNPVFGLNALGGSVNIQLKNGFTYHGGEVVLGGGSFGQGQAQAQYGVQSKDGSEAIYFAGTALHQDGWRDLQSTDIYNVYGDVGLRGQDAEMHLSVTAAQDIINGPGTAPLELLLADPRAQFTAPNLIANKYIQVNLSGTYEVNDTTSVQAVAYYENFEQRVVNGNAPNDTPCNDGTGLLCSDPGVPSTTRGGAPIPDFLNGGPYSELDDQTTTTNGYGLSLQATNTNTVFGFNNHLVGGFSFDGAQTEFSATSFIGGITPLTRVFIGPGVVIDEPGQNQPVRVAINDAYYGAFFTDTFDVTSKLSITASGRFNAAQIDLTDQGGGDLTGQHTYNRFNPAAGLTYKLTPWMTLYGGYSEANRAPTPAELSCAGPADSCSLANFFVGDPDLKQVVAHTVELGVRGGFTPMDNLKLNYNVGLYHTDLDDDIIFVNSATLGRAFFTNVGQTRRQGVDAGLQARTGPMLAYLNYSYTDATFQTPFTEGSGSNPQADANGNIQINKGDTLPGVPKHQVKAGIQYKVTEAWTVGATGIYASGAYLFGDEANLTPKLPAYFTMNLNTSYQITPNFQIFGLAQNVTDQRYYTFGTFSPTNTVSLAQAPNATNPRSYSLAAPIGGFGGVRITF